jgi:hypothetical protein
MHFQVAYTIKEVHIFREQIRDLGPTIARKEQRVMEAACITRYAVLYLLAFSSTN